MKWFTVLLIFVCLTGLQAGEKPALVLKKTISLPGVKGRFDHFALDEQNHRLFVAALGNDTLEVVDVAAGQQLKSVSGVHRPTGVVFLPEQHRIAVADSGEGTLAVFNSDTLALEARVDGLSDADNVRFDAKAKRIYVGFGDGALGIVDAGTMKLVGSVKLAAHPESFQLEPNGKRVFVNLPEAKQIAVIDREKPAVMTTWPMEKFRANFPMALDEARQRLFIGCRNPAHLVVLDTASGKMVADLAVSGDTDDLFYDAKRGLIYLICGEGFVDVIHQTSANVYELKERISARAGARTGWFSAAAGELYVAVPKRGDQSAELRVFGTGN